MTYYLQQSEWMNALHVPEGMNLDMINMPDRLDMLLKPALQRVARDRIVIDLGAGTGVLGMFALANGAEFVYFVEQDPQMVHILNNILAAKLDSSQYKIIHKDIESLEASDFGERLPEIAISEFYGPRLFDEGYVNYTKHLRSLFSEIKFIPEIFEVEFYLTDIDYSQDIWPHDETLIDHFRFMYREKGFAKHINIHENKELIGKITFNANTQNFVNEVRLLFDSDRDRLLVGVANVISDDLFQYYSTFGWYMNKEDSGTTQVICFDESNYFNPRKTTHHVQQK